MDPTSSLFVIAQRWLRGIAQWLLGWWQIIFVGAQLLVLTLSPSSYRASQRVVIYQKLYMAKGYPLSSTMGFEGSFW